MNIKSVIFMCSALYVPLYASEQKHDADRKASREMISRSLIATLKHPKYIDNFKKLKRPNQIDNVGILPNGSIIASSNPPGSLEYTITLWSATGQCLQTLHGAPEKFGLAGIDEDGYLWDTIHNPEIEQYASALWNGKKQQTPDGIALVARNDDKMLEAVALKGRIRLFQLRKVSAIPTTARKNRCIIL